MLTTECNQSKTSSMINTLSSVKANIYSQEKEVSIVLFVPGFKKEQISMTIHNNQITIKGKRDIIKDSVKYLRKEFLHDSFQRTFEISKELNLDLATAKLENGVLKITIPRNEIINQIKQINIQ